MKKFLLALTFALLSSALLVSSSMGVLAGCGHIDNSPFLSSPVDSWPERQHRHKQIVDLGMRQSNEDIDKILLLDRSSRLMYWHAQYGN